MSRWKRLRPHVVTLALSVAAATALVAVLVDRGRVSTEEEKARERNLFPAWRESAIERLALRVGDETWTLVASHRGEGDDAGVSWALEHDGEALDADPQAVSEFLGTLEFAGYERKTSGNAVDAALADPSLELHLEMGGLTLALYVGGAAPSPPGARYAAVDVSGRERARFVVTKELVAAIESAPPTLRAHELTPYLSLDLAAIAAKSARGSWRLVRGGWAGRDAVAFALERGGQKLRASRAAVDGLLGALGRLEADHFVAGPAPTSNPDARFVLTLSPRDASRPEARLEIGGPCPERGGDGVFVVRTAPHPVAACLPETALRGLELGEDELLDRRAIGAEPHDIIELKLSDPGRKVELARMGEGWHMRFPVDSQLSADVVEGRLDQILAIEGELLPATSDRAALGLDPPARSARVLSLGRAGGEERTETVHLGVEKGGKIALERVEDGALLALDPAAAHALSADSATLRAFEIYSVELKWFRALSVTARERHQSLTRDAAGSFTLLAPKLEGLRADPGLASELAERFGSLRAVSWVAEKADAAMGLDRPWCRIEAELAEEGKPDGPFRKIGVSLGAPAEGGYYARHDDDPAVFVAPKGLADMAQSYLLDRAALLVDLARVRAVRVQKGARGGPEATLALEKKGAHLRVLSGPNKTDSAAAVVEDALRQMMAEGVVRLGPKERAEGFEAPLMRLEIELTADNPSAKPETVSLEVGGGDVWHETNVFYVRKNGLDATFAVAQARLRPLSELFP